MSTTLCMTACAADRSADAERIRAAVQTMPGVDVANVDYVNDFENGANLDIRLAMPHATIDQIRAAADGINDLEGSDFDDHRQKTTISVADSAEVEYGGYGTHLDASQISSDVTSVRGLRTRATAASIRWQHFNDYSSLDLSESTNPDSDLLAAIAALPGSSTHLTIASHDSERQNSWDVALPLTLGQMNDAVGIRDRLPVVVYELDMRDGRISGLSVNLGESVGAVPHAVAVVSAVAPTTAHPLSVEWRLAAAAPGEVGRFTACSPASGDWSAAPAEFGFAALKERFALTFTGCGP